MSYWIAPVTVEDVPVLTTIQWAALHDNPLIQTIYPRGPTSALVDFTTASYRKALAYPSVHIVKATDKVSGQIVAFAKWIIFRRESQSSSKENHENIAEIGGRDGNGWQKRKTSIAPPDCYSRVLDDWNAMMTKRRRIIMQNHQHTCQEAPLHSLSCYFESYGKDLWVLDILHTHPLHQRKGAGAQLVRWGTDMADNDGLLCYLEASTSALKVFRDRNFEDRTQLSIDLGKYKDGYGAYTHTIMLRPPYGLSMPDRPPPIPPKSTERQWIPQMIMPEWVERISEVDEDLEQDTSPTLEYTAEAKMLDMRASASPRPSLLDVRTSIGSRSPRSGPDIRSSSSTRSLRPSLLEVGPNTVTAQGRAGSMSDLHISVDATAAAQAGNDSLHSQSIVGLSYGRDV